MWRVVELTSIILLFAFVVTQMFIPLMMERRMFPLFRRSNKLEKTLVSIHEIEAEVALQKEAETRLDHLPKPAPVVQPETPKP